jgi:hypothetical protein
MIPELIALIIAVMPWLARLSFWFVRAWFEAWGDFFRTHLDQ